MGEDKKILKDGQNIRVRAKKWLLVTACIMPFIFIQLSVVLAKAGYRSPFNIANEFIFLFVVMIPSYLCVLFLPESRKRRMFLLLILTVLGFPIAAVAAVVIGWDLLLARGEL